MQIEAAVTVMQETQAQSAFMRLGIDARKTTMMTGTRC